MSDLTDIVSRLAERADGVAQVPVAALLRTAAGEIERLRDENERLRAKLEWARTGISEALAMCNELKALVS